MSAPKIFVLTIVMLAMTANVFGDDVSPVEILEKTTAAYKSIKTYRAEGSIITDYIAEGIKGELETSFLILLKKPNMYLVSWEQSIPLINVTISGAVWSNGTQAYLYMGTENAYSEIASDELALGVSSGISQGASYTIPSLFLSVFDDQLLTLSELVKPKIETTETIEGEDYYVVSGSSATSQKEIFWISKTAYTIKKHKYSLDPPKGHSSIVDITDEQLAKEMKSMGLEVTEEAKTDMRAMLETSSMWDKKANIRGYSYEYHENISSPELKKDDFNFILPEGTILKKSLFDGFPGNIDESLYH